MTKNRKGHIGLYRPCASHYGTRGHSGPRGMAARGASGRTAR